MTKHMLLERAIDITKDYVKGSGGLSPDAALERIYIKLKDLNVEVEHEES